MLPVVASITAAGVKTFAGIAEALNNRGISTRRGGQWSSATVRRAMQRQLAPSDAVQALVASNPVEVPVSSAVEVGGLIRVKPPAPPVN